MNYAKAFVYAVRPFALSILLSPSAIAFAQNQAGCIGTSCTVQNPLGAGATFCTLIAAVLNAAMVIGVPIAILIIVYAGFMYVQARGNPGALEKAHNNLLYTIIGIMIFFGAGLIANVLFGTLQQLGVPGLSLCKL